MIFMGDMMAEAARQRQGREKRPSSNLAWLPRALGGAHFADDAAWKEVDAEHEQDAKP
jgi:hypothetical protein